MARTKLKPRTKYVRNTNQHQHSTYIEPEILTQSRTIQTNREPLPKIQDAIKYLAKLQQKLTHTPRVYK